MNSFFFFNRFSAGWPKMSILFPLILLCIISAKAQEIAPNISNGRITVTDDRLPEYPGGMDAFYRFITTNIRYPDPALKDSIKGIIFLGFDVEKDGHLTNISVHSGLNAKLNKEVIRVTKMSPKWRPAQENHVPVTQLFTLPVSFPIGKAMPWITDGADTSKIYSEVDQSAEFPGGANYLKDFVVKNCYYPLSALEKGIHGKVVVQFVVEKDGSISNISIMRGIGDGCDTEARRVFLSSPKWIPGKQNGVAVRQLYYVHLAFSLQNQLH